MSAILWWSVFIKNSWIKWWWMTVVDSTNQIEFVTFSSTGNAQDFGNLQKAAC